MDHGMKTSNEPWVNSWLNSWPAAVSTPQLPKMDAVDSVKWELQQRRELRKWCLERASHFAEAVTVDQVAEAQIALAKKFELYVTGE